MALDVVIEGGGYLEAGIYHHIQDTAAFVFYEHSFPPAPVFFDPIAYLWLDEDVCIKIEVEVNDPPLEHTWRAYYTTDSISCSSWTQIGSVNHAQEVGSPQAEDVTYGHPVNQATTADMRQNRLKFKNPIGEVWQDWNAQVCLSDNMRKYAPVMGTTQVDAVRDAGTCEYLGIDPG